MDLFISREQAEGDVLACAAFLAERVKSGEGHAEAMGEIVPRYLLRGDVDLAAELSNAIQDPFARDRLLIAVAEKCAEVDDDEYALQLAESLEDQSLQADALERIGLAKARKGQHEAAADAASRLVHPDFVYAAIAVQQAVSGDDPAAAESIDQIDFPAARVTALQQIADARIGAGDAPKAVESLDAAAAEAESIEHEEEKVRSLCSVAGRYTRAGRKDSAIATFDRARSLAEELDNQHQDYFLAACSLGFLEAGSSELADRALDLVQDKTQMASALLGFARYYWRSGEEAEALDALDEAHEILRSQRESETRDSRTRNALMATIAAQFAGFGKADRGVEMALENSSPAERTSALSQIAQVLTMAGSDDQARSTINEITEDADRLYALVAVADAKDRLNEREPAITLLDETLELAETVLQLPSRANVLTEIAARYAAWDSLEKSRRAMSEGLAVIQQIRDESTQAAALANLSEVYAGVKIDEQEREILRLLVRKAEL